MLRNLGQRSVEHVTTLEAPEVPITDQALAAWLDVSSLTDAGITVSDERALSKFVAYYRAVYLIACSIGGLPIITYRGKPAPGSQREFVDPPSVLVDPCPALEPIVFWETLLAHLLTVGNVFLTPTRNSFDQVVVLDFVTGYVEPRKVSKAIDPRRRLYDVTDEAGQKKTYSSNDVLHLMGPSINGMWGLSPVGVARNAVAVALAQEQYQGKLFAKGAMHSGVLTTDANVSPQRKRELIKNWQETSHGLENAGGVGMLTGGVRYQPLSMVPADAEFIASRYFQIEEIGRMFGIPPDFMGVTQGTSNYGTGVEQRGLHLVTYALMSWLIRLEQFMSRRMLPRGTNAEIVPDGLYRSDVRARTEASVRRVLTGLSSVNEERLAEGRPPIAGGDVRYMPANMLPLGPDGLPIAADTDQGDEGEPGDVNDVDAQPDRVKVTYDMVEALLSLGGVDGNGSPI